MSCRDHISLNHAIHCPYTVETLLHVLLLFLASNNCLNIVNTRNSTHSMGINLNCRLLFFMT